MSVYAKVAPIIARTLQVPVDRLSLQSRKDDFEKWDSLQNLNLLTAIVSEFHYKFTLKEMIAIKSVKDIVDILETKTQGHAQSH
jgi:acyl carrier protein